MVALYDTIGFSYADLRQPDPSIEREIIKALGNAATLLNVGAGSGSYEPPDRAVVAVELSMTMIRQRPPGAGPVVQATAMALPFGTDAFDASMAIYQFLIAVRSGGPNAAATMLTNADGETTSHIQGMFNRTIRYLTEGIKPCFVFDGKPPQIKSGELQKRREKREKAEEELKKAAEEGNVEEQDKQSKRLVRAGHKENEGKYCAITVLLVCWFVGVRYM